MGSGPVLVLAQRGSGAAAEGSGIMRQRSLIDPVPKSKKGDDDMASEGCLFHDMLVYYGMKGCSKKVDGCESLKGISPCHLIEPDAFGEENRSADPITVRESPREGERLKRRKKTGTKVQGSEGS